MAHTSQEQSIALDESTPCIDTLNDLFMQQFRYTQNEKYLFSPVDSDFGIRFSIDDDLMYTRIYATFDGGNTEIQLGFTYAYSTSNVKQPSRIYYHASKSEKVILLRIAYRTRTDYGSRIFSLLIAHDENNKTVCFRSESTDTSAITGYHTAYMIDRRLVTTAISDISNNELTNNNIVNKYTLNTVYRYPSFYNNCMFGELYKIGSLNSYDNSYLPSYINFNGEPYRIVSLSNSYSANGTISQSYNSFHPDFAFPVSD